jgi:hypothetical protein
MIKQQFNGEFIKPASIIYVKLRYTAHIIVNKLGLRKKKMQL